MPDLIRRSQPNPPLATMAQWEAYKTVIEFLNDAYNVGAWIGERDGGGTLFALDAQAVQTLVEQWARNRSSQTQV